MSGEYLLWWTKGAQAPALVTTGVVGATALPGALGQPGTAGLFGGSDRNNQARSGVRVGGGLWLDDARTVGLEGSYFYLGSRSAHFDAASNSTPGSAIIARPFFDALAGIPNAQLIAFPGIAAGSVHVSSSSRLQGADLNLLCVPGCKPGCETCPDPTCDAGGGAGRGLSGNAFGGGNYWVGLSAGVRYLQLDEGLGIDETTQVNPRLPAGPPLFGGSTIAITDQIDTHNSFYGGQVGARAEFCFGRAFADVRGKVALGVTHEVIDVNGSTSITSPAGAVASAPTGFLTSGVNNGHYTHDAFAVVPEFGADLGYRLTSQVRVFAGYTFLYWSSVVRPGSQLDYTLSGAQIPTDGRFSPQTAPARPAVFRNTDFWAQGVNFGVDFRY